MCHHTPLTPFEQEKILFFPRTANTLRRLPICWSGASRPFRGNFAAMRLLLASLCHIAR